MLSCLPNTLARWFGSNAVGNTECALQKPSQTYQQHMLSTAVHVTKHVSSTNAAVSLTDDDDRLDDEGRFNSQTVRVSPSMRQKMQRREYRDEAPKQEEEFEYGSKEADQAVEKLQELGAIVHPPGNKDSIDWGMLAGITTIQPFMFIISQINSAFG